MAILMELLGSKWTWIALVLAATLGFGAWEHHEASKWSAKFDAERTAFVTFQTQTRVVADASQQAANAKAQQQEQQVKQLEVQNVKDQKAITSRYEHYIAGLRKSATGSAGGNQVSSPAPTPTVCSDQAGNNRLSNALRVFEIGTVQLLEVCESQAQDLNTVIEAWPK